MSAAHYKELGPEHLGLWRSRLNRFASYVYVIQGEPGTPIKVGFAHNVSKRLAGLQTGNPQLLRLLHVLPGDRQLEWFFHDRLKGSLIHGEWFAHGDEVLDFLVWVSGLAQKMVDASGEYDDKPPSYYELDPKAFVAPAHRQERPITVSWVKPSPKMAKEEAERVREFHREMREFDQWRRGR